MKPHQKLGQQRLKLGLSDVHLANAAHMSDMAYYDLEAYESDIYDCVELRQLRIVCAELQLDIVDLLGIDHVIPVQDLQTFLHTKRTEKGLSILEVSDHVGIVESAISDAERDPQTLETWRLTPLQDHATCLGVELACLIER